MTPAPGFGSADVFFWLGHVVIEQQIILHLRPLITIRAKTRALLTTGADVTMTISLDHCGRCTAQS